MKQKADLKKKHKIALKIRFKHNLARYTVNSTVI